MDPRAEGMHHLAGEDDSKDGGPCDFWSSRTWPGAAEALKPVQLRLSYMPCGHMQMPFLTSWFLICFGHSSQGSLLPSLLSQLRPGFSFLPLSVECSWLAWGRGLLPGQLPVRLAQSHVLNSHCVCSVSQFVVGRIWMFHIFPLLLCLSPGGLVASTASGEHFALTPMSLQCGCWCPNFPHSFRVLPTFCLTAPTGVSPSPWTVCLPLWHLHLQDSWASQTSQVQSWTLELPLQPSCLTWWSRGLGAFLTSLLISNLPPVL